MSIDIEAVRKRAERKHADTDQYRYDILALLDEVERLRDELDAAQEARDINLRGLAEFAAQLTEQRDRANRAESELAAHQDAVDAVKSVMDHTSYHPLKDQIRAALDEHLGEG